jgi:hypothetical protein
MLVSRLPSAVPELARALPIGSEHPGSVSLA